MSRKLGVTAVYLLNVLKIRQQAQGTALHRQTTSGVRDTLHQTVKRRGFQGLYKGLAPILLKKNRSGFEHYLGLLQEFETPSISNMKQRY